MPTATFLQADGTKNEIDVPSGKRVMQSTISSGIGGIVAECGGQAMCAT